MMKLWHFALIALLIALPSSGVWLAFHSKQDDAQAGLFGITGQEIDKSPVPPVFLEEPLVITEPEEESVEELVSDIISAEGLEEIKSELFSEIVNESNEQEPIELPSAEEAIPLPASEEEEEDIVAEP